jgi:hypothetical protein
MMMCDFRLPPRSRRNPRSSGSITQRVVLIPYQRFGTTYRSQESKKCFLAFEDGTDTLYLNVSKELPLHPALCPGITQVT